MTVLALGAACGGDLPPETPYDYPPPPPEVATAEVDTDADGVGDSRDECPNQAGPRDDPSAHGCPAATASSVAPPPQPVEPPRAHLDGGSPCGEQDQGAWAPRGRLIDSGMQQEKGGHLAEALDMYLEAGGQHCWTAKLDLAIARIYRDQGDLPLARAYADRCASGMKSPCWTPTPPATGSTMCYEWDESVWSVCDKLRAER